MVTLRGNTGRVFSASHSRLEMRPWIILAFYFGIIYERGNSIVWANGFGAFAVTKAQIH
ncbi:MAG: hypothetical protein KQI35_19110 [Bacteroidetes bacterium]|nr:hypothetical protein [Bacteroidota bacterium]